MTKDDFLNSPKYAGIYYFKNKINGKYYIGQAVKLRKRLLHHYSNYNNERYSNLAIYRAFKKYGLENFELGILDTFIDALNPETKVKLDELEKKYIQEYNSYGDTGYNMTLGGDAGVLGLKQTTETKKLISTIVSKRYDSVKTEPCNWIKAKNWKTGYTIVSIKPKYLAETLKVPTATILKCLSKKQSMVARDWTISYYFDEFPEPNENYLKYNNSKATIEKVKNILEEHPNISYIDFNKIFPINRNTFFRYRKILNMVPNRRTDTKVQVEVFKDYIKTHTKEECMEYFNIKPRTFYSYRQLICRSDETGNT